MRLTLSTEDLRRVAEVQRCLLSPLGHSDVRSWTAEMLESINAVFRTDTTLLIIPHGKEVVHIWDSSLDDYGGALSQIVVESGKGLLRFGDRQMDQALGKRRQAGMAVWSCRMVEKLDGRPMERMPWYHEFMLPAGTVDGGGMCTVVDSGEAYCCSNPGPPGRNVFGDEWLKIFRLLLPSFKAGVSIAESYQARRDALGSIIDALAEAVCVIDVDGGVVHRNASFEALVASADDGETVQAMVAQAAAAALRLLRSATKATDGEPEPTGTSKLTTRSGSYLLSTSVLPDPMLGGRPAVLVRVESSTPAIPSRATLIRAYGLTRREADVARLLATGCTNQDAADRLGISANTVRTHAQNLFLKLGVHTRKALALRLLSGGAGGRLAATPPRSDRAE